jgi:hypothetical protein
LNIGLDLSDTYLFQNGNKLFHRQGILPSDVDASEKCDVSIHSTID